jgi:putative ABC transport system permease protein
MFGRIRSFLQAARRRREFEDGMAEEVRFHMEAYTDDLIQSGMPPEEAARRARMELGSVDSVKSDCRESRGLATLDALVQDLHYALRLLGKNPAFTATALTTLALCLGANLTIFAVVDSVLLRPLPFPAADRLVRVFNTYPKAGVRDDGMSITNYYERRGHLPAFTSVAAIRERTAVVGESGSTEREPVAQVSPDFFATVGLAPVVGRGFTDEETTYETDGVAVVTDAYWRQHLGRDPHVIGKTIRVDGFTKTVVGLLPPGFSFLSSRARLFFPLASSPEQRLPRQRHSGSGAQMIARLAPGATVAEAQSQVDRHNAAVEGDDPQAKRMAEAGFHTLVVPLQGDHVAKVRPALLLLQAGVLFLLLIGAVNVANLLLIRAGDRMKEFAVRQALGASRRQVIREVVTETTVLTLLGGMLGLAVGAAGIRLLGVLGAELLPLGTRIVFDARVALAALAAAVVLGLAIAAPIAWYTLRTHATGALHDGGRGATAGRAASRLRHGFLVAQMTLAFVLLSGAGLLALSLEKVMALSPGFLPQNILSGQITLPWKTYDRPSARLALTQRLLEELSHQPGVRAVGVSTNVPLSGRNGMSAATVKGHVVPPGGSLHGHYSYGVGGAYFEALGFALREGRFLTAADSGSAQRACVVDEDFARRYFPGRSAVGQRLFPGSKEGTDAEAFTIVGVVGPVKQAGLTEDDGQGAVYYPYVYRADNDEIFVVARTSGAPESFVASLRSVVRQVDPDLPITDLRSKEGRITDSLVERRSPALLAGLFSAIALLLTAVGTYGVLSYAVAGRRREIGLRMALGARPDQVRTQFLSLALRLLAAGTVLGGLGAWLTGQAMRAVLFQVPPVHGATLAGTAAIMGVVSLTACLLPSHRAARISPMEALAEE